MPRARPRPSLRGRLAATVELFAHTDPGAGDWLTDDPEAPDCNVLADAFTTHCLDSGIGARTIKVEMYSPEEPLLGEHYFTVLDIGVAVDWTARQFATCEGMPLPLADIPVPLVFRWPGDYPLPTLTAATADPTPGGANTPPT